MHGFYVLHIQSSSESLKLDHKTTIDLYIVTSLQLKYKAEKKHTANVLKAIVT